MCGRLCFVCLVGLLCSVGHVQAEPFSLLPTFDGHVSNDAQEGPDASPGGSGMHIRDIPERRRVGFAAYDLAAAKELGVTFANVSFSNYGHDGGTVNVYGVLEEFENLVAEGMTWNTAPGVQNDPAPSPGDPVALDLTEVTDVLLTFDAPARGNRASTDISEALAEFLNSDTNGIVAFMFAPAEGGNAILRTVEMGADGGTRLEGDIGGLPVLARNPSPADEAVDVDRDTILSWTPGGYAASHDVYFGTVFEDVNAADRANPMDVLVRQGQEANTFDPGRLAFGETYYWRIDEVNMAPDATIPKGTVWSFTAEPFAVVVENIIATASSTDKGGPEKTIDGSGLSDADEHSATEADMWLSAAEPAGAWIQYEFDKIHKLDEMWIWNYNATFEPVLGVGFRDVTIELSTNGTDWTPLDGVPELAQAPGLADYTADTILELGGAPAKYVRLTANSNWSTIGLQQYGLSEVRFLSIPVHARAPQPAPDQTGVHPEALLSWRPGREADQHDVYLSTDSQAVIDGTAPVETVLENSYDLAGLDLGLGQLYYWMIVEVNEAETPSDWAGNLWSFTTEEYLVVDDFESYTDAVGERIFQTWLDGWGYTEPEVVEGNGTGATVGYTEPPFAEQTIVHEGRQSMPLAYDNTVAPGYSETQCTFDEPQDWTAHGVTSLTLYFYGSADSIPGQLYLSVDGMRADYTGPAEDLTQEQWLSWAVDLASLGVNLQSVSMLSIGVDGGAALGMLYIDSIRLYP